MSQRPTRSVQRLQGGPQGGNSCLVKAAREHYLRAALVILIETLTIIEKGAVANTMFGVRPSARSG